jgi:probable HAF family extracellular repeat protein
MIELATFGGANSYAYFVNEAGQIVGASTTTNEVESHAVFWLPGPAATSDCMNGGWRTYGVFRNQDDCIRYVESHRR